MAKDLLVDLIILAAQEKREILCETVHEAISWRQKVYGKKKQLLKDSNRDLPSKNAANNFETRLLDKDKQNIRLNGKDYQTLLASGQFSPCYLVLQPSGTETNAILEKHLADRIAAGQLPSQIAEAEYKRLLFASDISPAPGSTGKMVNPFNPPAPKSPFAAMGFDPSQMSIESLYKGLEKTQSEVDGNSAETDETQAQPKPADSSDKPD